MLSRLWSSASVLGCARIFGSYNRYFKLHENLEAAKYWLGLCVAFAVFYPVIISCNLMLSKNSAVSEKPQNTAN
jgi:hypothetical protein